MVWLGLSPSPAPVTSTAAVVVMMMSLAPLTLLVHSPRPVKHEEAEDVGKCLEDHVDDDEASQTIANDFDGLVFTH